MSQLPTDVQYFSSNLMASLRLCSQRFRRQFWEYRRRQVWSQGSPHQRPDPEPSAGEITPPWAPIVRLPALNHALIIMGWYVEMHEVYSSVCSFRGEGEDQGRISFLVVEFGRAPGLDHEPLRDDLERCTGERAVEGLEWRTWLDADRDRRTSDRRMLRGIGVYREETFG